MTPKPEAAASDSPLAKIGTGQLQDRHCQSQRGVDKLIRQKASIRKLEERSRICKKPIDELSTRIEAAKKDYEARKDKMSDAEKDERKVRSNWIFRSIRAK